MADMRDLLAASTETDAALQRVWDYGAMLEGGAGSDAASTDVAMAVLLGSRAEYGGTFAGT